MQPSRVALDPLIAEGERIMGICNSCRYCEGFCAVFPAMERRLNFSDADVNYLANLCHNCGECLYACQYAPPHEFAINVPKTFVQIRAASYKKYAWPKPMNLHARATVPLALLAFYLIARSRVGIESSFYCVISHEIMVAIFLTISIFIFTAHVAGFLRFWRETGEGLARFFTPSALMRAAKDALSLKNLSSNGAGCTYPDASHSDARRMFHHFTFYGFALCFASTTVAAVYHFAGRIAPYPFFSAPVVLGTLGGVGLLIGPAGLFWLKNKRDPLLGDAAQDSKDRAFIALLFFTALTGMFLLILRGTSAMSALLIVHLAVVAGLFLTLPYGKFVHGIYRSAALVRSALETARAQNQRSGQSH